MSVSHNAPPPATSTVAQSDDFAARLQAKWDATCAQLGATERAIFEKNACVPGGSGFDKYLAAIDEACKSHSKESKLIRASEWISPIVKWGELILPFANVAASASPTSPAPIVLGGIAAVLKLLKNVGDLQSKTMEMLRTMAWQSSVFKEWDRTIYLNDARVQDCLLTVYGDILLFCSKAFRFSKEDRGRVKGFRLSLVKTYEDYLGKETGDFKQHMAELKWAAKNRDKERLAEVYQIMARQEQNQAQQFDLVNRKLDSFSQQTRQMDLDRRQEQDAAEEQRKLDRALDWLSSHSTVDRYNECRYSHLDGTGTWLLQSDTFLSWRDSAESDLLWVQGKPGCGKSILSAVAINHLCNSLELGQTCAYTICKTFDDRTQTANAVLGMLARQIAVQLDLDSLNDIIKRRHRASYNAAPGRQDLIDMIQQKLDYRSTTYICIDGLDECKESRELVDSLARLVKESSCTTKVLIFSRADTGLKNKLLSSKILRPDDGSNKADLLAYIDSKFVDDDDEMMNADNVKLRQFCVDKAEGMFKWVELLHHHLDGIPRRQQAAAVKDLPSGLDGMYDKMLERIWENEYMRQSVIDILCWVTDALEPLTPAQVSDAIGFSDETKQGVQIRSEDLEAVCKHIVAVDTNGFLRLCHESARDYLDKFSSENPALQEYRNKRQNVHFDMGDFCVSYLLRDEFKRPVSTTGQMRALIRQNAFVIYASRRWGEHVKKVEQHFDLGLLYRLCCSNERCLLMRHVIFFSKKGSLRGRKHHMVDISLHLLASYGLVKVAQSLAHDYLVNFRHDPDGFEYTPLIYALQGGHLDMAEWLVNNDSSYKNAPKQLKMDYLVRSAASGQTSVLAAIFDPSTDQPLLNTVDVGSGAGLLVFACQEGHVEVARFLIAAGADVNFVDTTETPLVASVHAGRGETTQLLLKSGADVNKADNDRWTALHWAAYHGNQEITRILLEHGADIAAEAPDSKNSTALEIAATHDAGGVIEEIHEAHGNLLEEQGNRSLTALHYAAWNNALHAARALVRLGAQVSAVDNYGQTALFMAISEGSSEMVRFFLEHERDITRVDDNRGTVLHLAAGRGNMDILRMVLRKVMMSRSSKALIDHPNSIGDHALHLVVAYGTREMFTLLRSHGADIRAKGRLGASVLHFAAHYNRNDIAKTFMKETRETVPRDELDNTPLIYAVQQGNTQFVEVFIADCAELHLTLDISAANVDGSTALHTALNNDFHDSAKLLLDQGAQFVPNVYKRWPVHLAARSGFPLAGSRLLDDPGMVMQDVDGCTPLFAACSAGHMDCTKALLSKTTENVNTPDNQGRTPTLVAMTNQHADVVHLLLEKNPDLNVCDGYGNQLIHLAAFQGDLGLVKRLLAARCAKEELNWYEETPFLRAVAGDSIDIVKEMDSYGLVKVNARNALGEYPHMLAARSGSLEMMSILEASGAVPYGSTDHLGRTAAFKAADRGHWHILAFLRDHGEDLSRPDHEGDTALIAAAEGGYWGAVGHLVNFLPARHINYFNQGLEKKSALSSAAVQCHANTFEILLILGSDTNHRDWSGLSIAELVKNDERCVSILRKHQRPTAGLPREDASDVSEQRAAVICECCDNILQKMSAIPDDAEQTASQEYHRLSRVQLLARALLSQEDHALSLMCFMECAWRPKSSILGVIINCAICHTRLSLSLRFWVCKTCYTTPFLCDECHTDYNNETKRIPQAVQEIYALEMRMKRVRKAIGECQISSIGLVLARLRELSILLEEVDDQYKLWQLSYKVEGKYTDMSCPGSELLAIMLKSGKMDWEPFLTPEGKDTGCVDHTKFDKIEKDYVRFRREHKLDRDDTKFQCNGHEYMLVSEDDRTEMQKVGQDLDPETGFVTAAFLARVKAKYVDVAAKTVTQSEAAGTIKPLGRASTLDVTVSGLDLGRSTEGNALFNASIEFRASKRAANRFQLRRARTDPLVVPDDDDEHMMKVFEELASLHLNRKERALPPTAGDAEPILDGPEMSLSLPVTDETGVGPEATETQLPTSTSLARDPTLVQAQVATATEPESLPDIDDATRAVIILFEAQPTPTSVESFVLSAKIGEALEPGSFLQFLDKQLPEDADEATEEFFSAFYQEYIQIENSDDEDSDNEDAPLA